MKIAYISSHIGNSLQFVWFQQKLKINHVDHIHIVINTTSSPLIFVSDLKNNGLVTYELHYKNSLSLIKLFFQIRSILKKEKINIVHTTLPYGNLIGQLSAISLGINGRLTTCENASWAFDYHSKKQWLIDKFTFWSSKKVISVADTANDFLLTKWKINPDKLIQINHALKFEDYETISTERIKKLESQLSILPNDFIIGMISRTEFWKGHPYAVEAMVNIAKKYPTIKLLICGSMGFDHQKLLDMISKYNLENNIRFIGFVSDPIAFLKLIKIQIHIPINKYVENCGISIIEGMAAKTPQLLTLSGYAHQSAKHLHNAYVVDYCNAKEIEVGIEYLYANYDKALMLGEQAYQDAMQEYTVELKYKKHLAIYNEITKN